MHRGDILEVDLRLAPGSRAQGGRRPAIAVLAETALAINPVVTVVPLTSQQGALRFRYTFQIEPSRENGLTLPSVALVFQIRAEDRARILHVRGRLEAHYMAQLDALLREMLGL
jgi:mRNA interferase MazF